MSEGLSGDWEGFRGNLTILVISCGLKGKILDFGDFL